MPRSGLQRKRAAAALSQASRAWPDQPIRAIQRRTLRPESCDSAAAHLLRLRRPARLASSSAMNINELMNTNDVRESATIFPRPCKLTLKVVSE